MSKLGDKVEEKNKGKNPKKCSCKTRIYKEKSKNYPVHVLIFQQGKYPEILALPANNSILFC